MLRILVLSLLVFIANPAFAAEPPWQQRTIAVTGDAEIKVVRDQVQLAMTAENRGRDLIDTKSKNDAAVKALVEYATKELGVEARHVQTDFVTVEPQYRNCHYDDELSGKCSPLEITYYTVRKGVQICLKDITKYEDLVTKALQLGVNRIDNIQFVTTELRKHRDKARDMAATASKEKAEAVAKTLGMKVAKPININTQNYSSYYWHGSYGGGRNSGQYTAQNAIQQAPSGGSEGGGELALGQISVSAQVSVTYELE